MVRVRFQDKTVKLWTLAGEPGAKGGGIALEKFSEKVPALGL